MKILQRGFTLVELMIVVSIIAIIAAVAIPNFLKLQARSRSAEAKANLKGMFSAKITQMAETETYTCGGYDFCGWEPRGQTRYHYFDPNSTLAANGSNELATTCTVSPANVGENSDPYVGSTGFTLGASGNIDTDATCDQWELNDAGIFTNIWGYRDVND